MSVLAHTNTTIIFYCCYCYDHFTMSPLIHLWSIAADFCAEVSMVLKIHFVLAVKDKRKKIKLLEFYYSSIAASIRIYTEYI